ncbi:uncharacterized protein I206_105569 [Kwoniella pini CBS 10737]|uniref:Uncharacterized protein n=1 Tax=Kwoniella pini CBS 10737 TaxID=1296096 RepID=A0A1B9I3W1_9TREE|nr:uncharacterized protein I206_03528 [Kwoniella pini CBS 10737]OCF50209.1 hypothetical protein I206_03528 [Kwoniella pini CBS 10737]
MRTFTAFTILAFVASAYAAPAFESSITSTPTITEALPTDALSESLSDLPIPTGTSGNGTMSPSGNFTGSPDHKFGHYGNFTGSEGNFTAPPGNFTGPDNSSSPSMDDVPTGVPTDIPTGAFTAPISFETGAIDSESVAVPSASASDVEETD